MTGSVSGESHGEQPNELKTSGKSVDSTPEKTQQQSISASNSPKEKTSLLSSLEALTLKTTDSSAVSTTPAQQRKPPAFNRSASSLPRVTAKKMDEGASSLARRGRAQSVMTLYSKPTPTIDHIFNAVDDERDSGARSEVSAPVSRRRRRHVSGEVRAYGTLERATSYGSLTSRSHFRSANSARPRPAPPCTTTHLDFSRHPANPANSRHHLARAGTSRRNNPHPVGLHFQSPYNRDGKTFEVWSPEDESIIANKLPQMCNRIDKTNFSSGKTELYPSRGMPPSAHPGNNGSVYRTSYRTPQGARDHDRSLPTTRFGSTHNRVAAIGVVPNVMTPRCVERRVRLHIPRGQKLESLV